MGLFDIFKKKEEEEDLDLGGEEPLPAFGAPTPPGGPEGISGEPLPPASGEKPLPPVRPSPTPPPMPSPEPQPTPAPAPYPISPRPITIGREEKDEIERIEKDIEVLSAKLDNVLSILNQINSRLEYIERYLLSGGRRY